jgi:hypothetical protein
MTQLAIDFDRPSAAPEVSEAQVAELIAYLTGRGWTYRREIEADTGWNERTVRALASAARPRVVSYPGSPGYKLWDYCTVEEHEKCMNAFRSVRDEAAESYLVYSRKFHALGRA